MVNETGEERQAVMVETSEFSKANGVKVFYDEPGIKLDFKSVSVNRPGLVFAGFEEYFAESRIQVCGSAEIAYLNSLPKEVRLKRLDTFFGKNIPCVVLTRGKTPDKDFLEIAKKHKRAVFGSEKPTSEFVNNLVHYLNDLLAEQIDVHGELLDIAGIGVLITGENGIGKSETALELVHRGHMLVADDRVVVKKIKNFLFGSAPRSIKNLLEVRGVGIINVEDMYGISGVLEEKQIGLNVELVKWSDSVDRLCDKTVYTDILGVDIPKISIPVIAGRNLAIVIEAATKSMCLKSLGKNPIDSLLGNMQNLNNRQLD